LERAAGTRGSDPRLMLGVALARQGHASEAWSQWESGLARGLLDDFSARRLRPLTDSERHHEADLVGQLQQLDEQIARRAAKPRPNQAEERDIEELRQQQRELRGQFVSFENGLEERYHAFAGQPTALSALRQALTTDTALV